ncbi:MAG: imidazoleglycerol-phosphate dehydratase HisB [Clostridiales bacterium]|nr:MAG: imidazoleglycerol-phosphate dehydratase HisB [Clostridiales bacterium]
MKDMRTSTVKRTSKETDIEMTLNIDGSGQAQVDTQIGFFDHMLTALACHAGFDLAVTARGDLHVDFHHTVEDTGILLGRALREALGGEPVMRYGSSAVPMDEALAETVLDLSGRAYLRFDDGGLSQKIMPGFDAALPVEFLRAFACHSGTTLHAAIRYGDNAHHMTEALFKSLGRALRIAVQPAERVVSTKGMLD